MAIIKLYLHLCLTKGTLSTLLIPVTVGSAGALFVLVYMLFETTALSRERVTLINASVGG